MYTYQDEMMRNRLMDRYVQSEISGKPESFSQEDKVELEELNRERKFSLAHFPRYVNLTKILRRSPR